MKEQNLFDMPIQDLQSVGVVLRDKPDVVRYGGAGPSDHAALNLGANTLMVPLREADRAQHVDGGSPFELKFFNGDHRQAVLYREGTRYADVTLPARPKFYDCHTADGTPYWKIARLHGKDVLATTVLQTCIRYQNKARSCQFCAIGESLKQGQTVAHKRPEQLAEVADAAVRLDGVTHMVMTTGTPKGSDRGASVLCDSVRAVTQRVNLPIQVQCEPPDDLNWIGELKASGAQSIGMHLESVTEAVRHRIMPGKAEVPLAKYFEAFEMAVKHFGHGQVSTYILAGLGDSAEAIIHMSARLVRLGVYPFVVPFVPLKNTPLEDQQPPDGAFMASVYASLGPLLDQAGMFPEAVNAGCARCNACSSEALYRKGSKHAG